MLRLFARGDRRLVETSVEDGQPAPIWIDLMEPSNEEVQLIEERLGIAVPTRAEVEEIELSSRLYAEDGAIFMTLMALAQLDTDSPIKTPLTFVLKDQQLLTIRYAEPKPFLAYMSRAQRPNGATPEHGEHILFGLLEALIDRTADALERIGNEIDAISREVFSRGPQRADKKTRNLEKLVTRIGSKAELSTVVQESLVSASRLVAYYAAIQDSSNDTSEMRQLMRLVQRDAASLNEHARSLNARLDFLLNATLGLINLEQNQIIKIFSVAAVVFLPPTLVASIYGMNFRFMPELDWPLGYPGALGLMVLSAILPYLFFKRRGWL